MIIEWGRINEVWVHPLKLIWQGLARRSHACLEHEYGFFDFEKFLVTLLLLGPDNGLRQGVP